MLLAALRKANADLRIFTADDPDFAPYGERVPGSWSSMVAALEVSAPIPDEGVLYVTSHAPLESCADADRLRTVVFGDLPIQIGYCSGRNSTLNGLEYHKSSEVLVAAADLVLLLALRGELEHGPGGISIESSKTVGLLVHRGEAVELYSGTLHLAPCRARPDGFRAAIVLPRGTNEVLPDGVLSGDDPLLRKRNKWIMAHPERKALVDQGVLPLIRGSNREVRPVAEPA